MTGPEHGEAIAMKPGTEQRTISRFAGKVKNWLERRQQRWELAQLPASERARLYRDLGLHADELDRTIAGAQAARELLPRMLDRYGLDPASPDSVPEPVFRDLQRTCSACPAWHRCRQALDEGAGIQASEGFCPNSATIKALVQQQFARHWSETPV